jgi:very-short-patch-repair endonuclease
MNLCKNIKPRNPVSIFAFPASMTCVEVDGDQHLAEWHKRRDERRDEELANIGWKTVRICYDTMVRIFKNE